MELNRSPHFRRIVKLYGYTPFGRSMYYMYLRKLEPNDFLLSLENQP